MPNLLGAVETNLPNRLRFRLFEVGTAYLGTAEAPELDRRVCAAFIGSDLLGEFRAAVGAVEGLARAARLADLQVVDPDPGGWGDVALRRDVVADGRWIGRIAAVDIDDAAGDRVAVFFELRLDEVRTLSSRENRYEPVSPHPEATVDLSVWVPDGVRWIDVESACLAAAVDHLQVVDFVDDFRDDAGRRSLTLRLRLSSQERTLSSEDKAAARQALVDVLTAKLGATERA
jgi:phenylalanyl-tRNA synthetase beta subunit